MKKKTAELLLSSFTPPGFPQEKGMRKYQFYYDLFSDLTEGGIRSSIYQLVEKKYLRRLTLNGQSFFRITDAGIGKLTLLYPSLRLKERKKGDIRGHLLILIKPTDDDPHFIKLRRGLTKQMFSQVTRGVYYYPFPSIPQQLMSLLLDEYSSSVSIAEIKDFSLAFPDEKNFSLQRQKIIKESLSGTSKRITQLISSPNLDNRLKYQSKLLISNYFELFKESLNPESGLFFEDKANRELLFQSCENWNSLIELYHFSQKK